MEGSFEKSKVVYKSKIPEIERTIELIKTLKNKQESGDSITVNYPLCDTIYAKAQV